MYRYSHYKDKPVSWPSYLYNGNPYTCKISWSHDRLTFTMGILKLERQSLHWNNVCVSELCSQMQDQDKEQLSNTLPQLQKLLSQYSQALGNCLKLRDTAQAWWVAGGDSASWWWYIMMIMMVDDWWWFFHDSSLQSFTEFFLLGVCILRFMFNTLRPEPND